MSKPSLVHVWGPAVGMAAAGPGIRVLLEGWLCTRSACLGVQWGFPSSRKGKCSAGFPSKDKLPGKAGGPGKEPVTLDIPSERCVGPRGKGCAGGRNPPCTSPPAACCSQQSSHLNPCCKHQSQQSLKYRYAFISLLGWK